MQFTMSHSRPSFFERSTPVEAAAFDVQSGLFSTPAHDTVLSLFGPQHYEPGYAYPLLVWLHGPGNDERQLQRIMPHISLRNYVGASPRGITASQPGVVSDIVGSRKRLEELFDWPLDEAGQQAAEHCIFDCVDAACRRFNVHPRRIFLAGFDTGGTTALRVAMEHPYKFAGVLSIAGAFPKSRAPLSRLPEARNLAVLLVAGRKSLTYGETSVCEDLRLLHTAGLSTNVRLYPCGHEISPQMLTDIDRWMIEQITIGKQRDS